MIARPLDLASKLRPPPQGLGTLHYVNVGLLGLFFTLFGSRFVLAPGLGVDFQLPQLAGAQAGAVQTNEVISVLRSGQIFTSDSGLVDIVQLNEWLKDRASKERHPILLVRASSGVSLSELIEIESTAHEAGFRVLLGAEERNLAPSSTDSR
jgi:biopolymer transport protein ExbD